MRAPARVFGISIAVFLALTLILSRFQSETITNTINKFPKIKEAYQARAAAVQSQERLGSYGSSSKEACDDDSKSCEAPYTSKDGSDKKKDNEFTHQTSSDYDDDSSSKKGKDKDRRPSTKDDDRDSDRGFTDAEQAEALDRLEYKYGAEAKGKGGKGLLWMETTTTTAWGAERTEALDKEAEKGRKILEEEYGDAKPTKSADDEDDDDEAEPTEKGWRTTGFSTSVKTTQRTLIKPTTPLESAITTSTKKAKTKAGSTSSEPTLTTTTKGRKADKADATTTKRRWDDEAEPTTKKSRWDD